MATGKRHYLIAPEVARLRGQVAMSIKYKKDDIVELQTKLRVEIVAEAIRNLVGSGPPPTAEQIDYLHSLLASNPRGPRR